METDNEKILLLIPARMGSSRFPGKPMAPIQGVPMIGRVLNNVKNCKEVYQSAVATCDEEIFDYVESIGGKAVMTSNKHERASDRCAEALLLLEQELQICFDIVVMVQGDEPMVNEKMITESLKPMISNPSIELVNLYSEITKKDEFESANVIKVIKDKNDNALYFSRQPIPSDNESNKVLGHKQVCIIPFRRNFLLQYIDLEPTRYEIRESVDMMRVLEHGFSIKMVKTLSTSYPVDTPEDLERVTRMMAKQSC